MASQQKSGTIVTVNVQRKEADRLDKYADVFGGTRVTTDRLSLPQHVYERQYQFADAEGATRFKNGLKGCFGTAVDLINKLN